MDLQQVIFTHIPGKNRQSSGGWTSFNCPCCIEEGEPRLDTRMRGGVRSDGDSISYHCFNCGFTASHRHGRILNKKFLKLMRNMNVSESEIKRLQLEAIRQKELSEGPYLFTSKTQVTRVPSFPDTELPEGSEDLEFLLSKDNPPAGAIYAVKYLIDRGVHDNIDNCYWSPDKFFKNRVIFPFYQGDRIVGYTARDITGKSSSKYMTKAPKKFLHNVDKVKSNNKYLIVCEGIIDALALDCIAITSNEASQDQIDYINQFKGEVIVCPDRDKAGEKLIKQAQENGWSVSFPMWEDDIKDAADAIQRYGKLYTLQSIIDASISNNTKISVKMRIG